jgi:hypothetical protein
MSFKEKEHVQISKNPQSPQCQTEAELPSPFLTPLFFRYYLPLKIIDISNINDRQNQVSVLNCTYSQ